MIQSPPKTTLTHWRNATVDDVEQVFNRLNHEANLPWLEGVGRQALHSSIDGPTTRLLIFANESSSLAFAYLSHIDTSQPKIEEYAIFENGRGYGKRALAELIDYLAATSTYTDVWLHVVTNNHRAIHIYHALGFGDRSDVPGGWTNRLGQNVPIYRFWKKLNGPVKENEPAVERT